MRNLPEVNPPEELTERIMDAVMAEPPAPWEEAANQQKRKLTLVYVTTALAFTNFILFFAPASILKWAFAAAQQGAAVARAILDIGFVMGTTSRAILSIGSEAVWGAAKPIGSAAGALLRVSIAGFPLWMGFLLAALMVLGTGGLWFFWRQSEHRYN